MTDCTDCHAHNGPGSPGDAVHENGTVDFGGTYMGVGSSYGEAAGFGGWSARRAGRMIVFECV